MWFEDNTFDIIFIRYAVYHIPSLFQKFFQGRGIDDFLRTVHDSFLFLNENKPHNNFTKEHTHLLEKLTLFKQK